MTALEGKVLVVTGAAQGIGQGIALRAARHGAAVVCADIQDKDETIDLLRDLGAPVTKVVMDVRRGGDWSDLIATATADHGGVDLLANVAGIVNTTSPDNVVELTEEAWADVIATDLTGVWMGMRAAIPAMEARGGGRIVNISSLAALRGLPNLASYSAAKGGVAALTRQVAVEFADRNILVNAIAPGTIDTPILGDITVEMKEAFASAHALKRLGTPEDIATMVVHLFHPDSAFVTGQLIPIDGGWSVA
jgi:NAD(P)-dependent dehydrogenase (short-subunit alcohol dehydrogenase family)